MNQFDPPGFLNDFNQQQSLAWSTWVSSQIDEAAKGRPDEVLNDAPRLRFFNPLKNPPDSDAVEQDISWTAFPKQVQLDSSTDKERWTVADSSRDVQDEYCEWSVTWNAARDKILRVDFTTEAPEYWEFLALSDRQKVLDLYRRHASPQVQLNDLFDSSGRYVSRNKWNNSTSRGVMHLIQRNNTLGAEIELAAAATNVRTRNGQLLTGEQELIKCGRYGEAKRHSDPHIGAVVNSLARKDADIALANPIGLCIAELSTAGWSTPDNSEPQEFWSITRGTKEKALRAVYEVPTDRGFTISDIMINGEAIRFGAQIADCIKIKLTGLATRIGKITHPPMTACAVLKPSTGLAADQISVEAALLQTRAARR